MGGSQPSKFIKNNKLMEVNSVDNLSFLEDGQFAKIYKGHLVINKQPVTIKVPRVPPEIRREKSKKDFTHWFNAFQFCPISILPFVLTKLSKETFKRF